MLFKFINYILSFILNNRLCLTCYRTTKFNENICICCIENIEKIAPFYITVSNIIIPVFSLGKYELTLKTLINKKYGFNPLSFYILAKWLSEEIQKRIDIKTIDYLLYMPMNTLKKSIRRYNHMEECAKKINLLLKIPLFETIYKKLAPSQSSLKTKIERKENIKDAFRIKNGSTLMGKHLILIDDVFTTGSSVEELCKKLLPYNPASITIFVCAKKV